MCVSGVDERKFAAFNIHEEAAQKHRDRMAAIKDKITFRVLLKEGDLYFRNSGYIEYRWLPKAYFFDNPIYAYNGKLAFIQFQENNLVIHRLTVPWAAAAFRNQFDFMWANALVPPVKGKL